MSNEKFKADVERWAEKTGETIETVQRNIVLELFISVILDTPVLTGRLRANWQISSDNPATDIVESEATAASSESKSREDSVRGSITIKAVNDVVGFLSNRTPKKNFDIYLSNNLPYAYRIEYDGWSKKAPQGMVRRNIIRIKNNLAGS